MTSELKPVTFQFALLPILCLLILVIYGLIIRPLVLNLDQLPLEIIFITASVSVSYTHLTLPTNREV